jgi:hypothetical protein
MSTAVGTTTNSVSSKLSMFASKESIRTIIEIVVLIGVCYYFNKKHAKTFKHLEEMSQRLEDQEDMIEKQNATIKDLSEKVEMLMRKQVKQPAQQQVETPQYQPPPQFQSFQPQKVTQLPQFLSPPPAQSSELPKFQVTAPPKQEKVEDVQLDESSTKKKRARSPGPESSSAVEILSDDDLESELENELRDLE